MKIDWQTILYREARYPSSGDWYRTPEDPDTLKIRIARLSEERYEFVLGIHELAEAMLCHFMGVSQQAVDDFDMAYEAAHQRGDAHYPCGCPRLEYSSPGDDPHAPYRKQHRIAELVEGVIGNALDIDWDKYDLDVEKPPE